MDHVELTALAVNNTREFIKDTGHQAPDEAHILALLGIPPTSDEVSEMEDEASTRRLRRIDYLLHMITTYSNLFAKGTVAHERAHLPEEVLEHLPDGLLEKNVEALHLFGTQVAMAIISQFVDRGFLLVPETVEQPAPTKRRRGIFRRG
jgi:hypothetical protein